MSKGKVKIKPCPFCGHHKERIFNPVVLKFDYSKRHAVFCNWCAFYGPERSTRSAAIAAWNKRYPK